MKKIKEFLRKKKVEFLQNIADFTIERIKLSSTDDEFNYWYNFGMRLNMWCEYYDIYLQ